MSWSRPPGVQLTTENRTCACERSLLDLPLSSWWGHARRRPRQAPWPPAKWICPTAAMLDCAGLPCVEVNIGDGRHLRLAIDTGNPTSILSSKAALAMGIKQEPYLAAMAKLCPVSRSRKCPPSFWAAAPWETSSSRWRTSPLRSRAGRSRMWTGHWRTAPSRTAYCK